MKILAITLKELMIILRDRAALVMMLIAPLALALVMNFAFSTIQGGGNLPQIPMLIVNQDEGEIGKAVVDTFQSEQLSELVAPTEVADPAEARQLVDADKASAAVIIPAGLTQRVFTSRGEIAQIEVYENPGTPFTAGVVRGITERIVQIISAGATGARVTVSQLFTSGRAEASQEMLLLQSVGGRAAQEAMTREVIAVKASVGERKSTNTGFDYLAYYVPGMAVLFLMFSMMASGRTLLAERELGTLARLQAAPIRVGELLTGKVLGILATGLLQMTVLVIVARYLLGVHWGDPVAVAMVVVLTVSAVAALGLLISTLARSISQANVIGSAVVMILAAMGGNFVPRGAFPPWLKILSYVGPNAWAMEGFQKLSAGATLGALTAEMIALATMTVLFFSIAVWGFRRFVR